jgi:outer membrane biogenesis lipoprotein LolB
MKKLKFNSFIAFLTIVTSILILSCSKEEDKTQEKNITTDNNQTHSTNCDILGSLNVGSGTYTYTYTGDSGNTNINWTITPSSAANIISGQGTSTITITFNSSCSMSAFGSGGIGGICEDIKSITKNN